MSRPPARMMRPLRIKMGLNPYYFKKNQLTEKCVPRALRAESRGCTGGDRYQRPARTRPAGHQSWLAWAQNAGN